MTTEDKIKLLATEVMGWEIDEDHHGEYWADSHGWIADYQTGGDYNPWNPYTSSADNDALIEAFVGKYPKGSVDIYMSNDCNCNVEVWKRWNDGANEVLFSSPTTLKKNEAVAEAILKAIQ